MSAFLRKYGTGTGADVYIPIIKRGVVDFAVSADWTPASGDVKVSKDGGAAANIGTLPTAVTMGNTAMWKFVFADAELQCAYLSVTIADSATKAVEDQMFVIETYGNASAMHAFDLDTATQSVTVTTNNDKTGYSLAATTGLGNQTADITGNLSGSVGSVTGAVGSVTGAVGSVTGNVGGNVVGSVASVTAGVTLANGAITNASLAGNMEIVFETDFATNYSTANDQWVVSSSAVASVTGAVGSVTGAVGSVTGNVGGDVAGKVLGGGGSTITGIGAWSAGASGATLQQQIWASASATVNLSGTTVSATGQVTGGINTGSGVITTLDALDTAQDSQHRTTQTAINGVPANTAEQVWVTDLAIPLYAEPSMTGARVQAIYADTNELQTDWADGGRLDAILDARASQTSVNSLPAAVWNVATSTLNTAGSIGKRFVDWLAGSTNFAQWLGAIAGKQTSDATALAEINATGAGSGTFNGTTDSLEAIRDRGDAAWTGGGGGDCPTVEQIDAHLSANHGSGAWDGGSGGSGARTVAVTVNDGTDPIESANVRFTKGAESYIQATNASGQVTFLLDDGTWTVSVTRPGYTFTQTTLVVDGNESPTYSMTLVNVTPPANPSLSAIEVLCVDSSGQPESGVAVDIRIITVPTGSQNIAFKGAKQTATSDEDGIARFEVVQGSVCEWKRGLADVWQQVAIDADAVTSVVSVIGSP